MFTRIARIATVAAVAVAGALHVTSAPAAAAPYGGFHASCSSASGGYEYWYPDMSWSEFIQRGNDMFEDGLRIVQMDVVGHDVTAVWRSGSGAQWVKGHLSIDDLTYWNDYYYNQGLRLVDLDRDGNEFFAVWRPGSGGQFVRTAIPSWTDFKTQDDVLYAQGFRITDIIIREDGKIGGVWRADQGSSIQKWHNVLATGVDANNESAFQKLNRQYYEAGYELKVMKAHNNDAYRVGVWRYRGGSFTQATGNFMNAASMKGWEATCRSAGRRIVTLDVT
jgi:hypothetical protein